uniref:Ig-like domain-containing protein n=1 Tax=Periophthalmus magnuspinnatus TaxID=409849 RepID=A0A3B4A6C0_9GOBI
EPWCVGLLRQLMSIIHTLRIFETSSSQVPNFPEYVVVGVLNDLEILRCDGETRRNKPKQEWMNRVTEDDPLFWIWTTQLCVNYLQRSKGNIENIKQLLNQTEGAHIWQWMFGCDWDDETDDITGYVQCAFDGEDFISLDPSTESWVAAKSEAVFTKMRWERSGQIQRYKHYIHKVCNVGLKNFVRYGEKTLRRTELPLVSLLQKSSSSPVTCHATGFYPDRARLFWTKDGDELLEDVDPGEILPNEDATFQTSVTLDLSSVPSKDWDRYHCVFQVSGDKKKYSANPEVLYPMCQMIDGPNDSPPPCPPQTPPKPKFLPVSCLRSQPSQHGLIGILLQPDDIPYFRRLPPGFGATLTMEGENMVYSDSVSPTSPGI